MAEHSLPGRLHDALGQLAAHGAVVDSAAETAATEHYERRARERANADNQPLSTGATVGVERGNRP